MVDSTHPTEEEDQTRQLHPVLALHYSEVPLPNQNQNLQTREHQI